jgi:single stranded DNA-binding protein
MFRVAVSGRREQEPSFFTVVVWRDQAEHVAESLSKGSRVVVVGRLQRSWAAEDGSARSVVEVVAEELGPSLRSTSWTASKSTPGARTPATTTSRSTWLVCSRRAPAMFQVPTRRLGIAAAWQSTQLLGQRQSK